MGTITIPNSFVTGNTIDPSEVNANFAAITAQVNGNIDADNIEDGSITAAKISGQLAMSDVNSGVCMFQAYLGSTQAISSATKLNTDTEDFDITGVYDAATNYRFMPTTAGYYLVSLILHSSVNTSDGELLGYIYKNGAEYVRNGCYVSASSKIVSVSLSTIVQLNGSTDYLEAYGNSSGMTTTLHGSRRCSWNGMLIATS